MTVDGATWIPRAIAASGGNTADGEKKVLGRPLIDRLTVMVREAAQNSSDASRKPDGSTAKVSFSLEHVELDGPKQSAWHGVLDGGEPHVPAAQLADEANWGVLFVSDRGTSGLTGSTRADIESPTPHDYISFVLNFGETRDTELGGGTYGFGKASFFAVSRVGAIFAHTHTLDEHGERVSRLVGISMGHSYSESKRRFSGRLWWGRRGEEESIDPITGDEADAVAHSLGFPLFGSEDMGTTVAILAPEWGMSRRDEDEDKPRSPREGMVWLARAIGWHLWPKMIPDSSGIAEMTFEVIDRGEPIEIPTQENNAILNGFAEAFRNASGDPAGTSLSQLVQSAKPKAVLGRLGFSEKRLSRPKPEDLDEVAKEAGLRSPVNHVALMRQVNLIVKYLEVEPLPVSPAWYCGAFRVSEDRDQDFADAEPPTHEDWVTDDLPKPAGTYVRVALRNISREAADFAGAGAKSVTSGKQPPLGAVSDMLAGLLFGAPADGPSTASGPNPVPPGGQGGTKQFASLQGHPRFEDVNGEPLLIHTVNVRAEGLTKVFAECAVGVWGGKTEGKDLPSGASTPQVLGWRLTSSPDVLTGEELVLGADFEGEVELLVRPVEDAAVRVSVRLAPADDGEN